MMKIAYKVICWVITLASSSLFADDDILLIKSDLLYVGAFRLPYVSNQEGRLGFSPGRFTVNPSTNSMFITGNPFGSISEVSIPEIRNTTVLSEMAKAEQLQEFTLLKDRITHRTPNNDIRSIGGLELIDGKLIVTVFDGYDAASSQGFDVDNFFIINDPTDLENTTVTGYSEMEGNMVLTGWLSPIPPNLQGELGGDYLTGGARMASINGRWSMGPSAASLNKADLLNVSPGGLVPNIALQYYTLFKRMWWQLPGDVNNWNYEGGNLTPTERCPNFVNDASLHKQECVLDNDMWTEVSRAMYGQIIPGTRSYLTLGRVGGLRSGIAYKNTPIGRSHPCSGECPHDWNDWDNFVWLFDVQDLIDHKNGLTESYDAQPYEYGPIVIPGQDRDGDGYINQIIGADYDIVNNRLYLTMSGDDESGFEAIPWVAVYEIALNRPKAPTIKM